jgi:hypothetical protein
MIGLIDWQFAATLVLLLAVAIRITMRVADRIADKRHARFTATLRRGDRRK